MFNFSCLIPIPELVYRPIQSVLKCLGWLLVLEHVWTSFKCLQSDNVKLLYRRKSLKMSSQFWENRQMIVWSLQLAVRNDRSCVSGSHRNGAEDLPLPWTQHEWPRRQVRNLFVAPKWLYPVPFHLPLLFIRVSWRLLFVFLSALSQNCKLQ